MKCKLCPIHKIAGILVIVGALNWGLVGLFQWNLVTAILGTVPTIERVVYVLVGLAAIAMLFACHCKKCGEAGGCGGNDKSCCQSGGKM
ncbi:MAG: hypothetical protein A2261_01685 [Candidatus Magasanikbacteria bacterium RIFOXYA2_FULL_44_8]|uniref:DUF378 domain-containing protein n=1 Tax=Candidatus Magasanikbacteria bacterium RIFOXYA2_FULL_44_8 TaxID=1798696 RepID=A0A1F6NKW5_9BACT|nr:MAG: hypothetical protein A2261_01685 [Candidatus Magasanikbacteria bacterium RIFOXYA2_FULL_44_8]